MPAAVELPRKPVNVLPLEIVTTELAAIGATPKGGVRRLPLTDVDKRGRDRFRAELGVGAMLLFRDRMQCVSPAVVIVDPSAERAIVVTVAVCRHTARQTQTYMALALRVAEA